MRKDAGSGLGRVSETAPVLLQMRTTRQALRLAKVAAGYEGTSISSLLREGLDLYLQERCQAPAEVRYQLRQALRLPASARSVSAEAGEG